MESSQAGRSASTTTSEVVRVRPALPRDVGRIEEIVEPYAERRILLGKDRVSFYEAVQEFVVAESADGSVIGCGALHVLWEDLAEVRTLAVAEGRGRRGVGHALLGELLERAVALGLSRVFCLTFETGFFARHGFHELEGLGVPADVYAELLRSPDGGVAEFLDLARCKPNTLGNTRMITERDTQGAWS